MSSHVTVDRLQFSLTVTFHYLFPILTMGVGLFVAYLHGYDTQPARITFVPTANLP